THAKYPDKLYGVTNATASPERLSSAVLQVNDQPADAPGGRARGGGPTGRAPGDARPFLFWPADSWRGRDRGKQPVTTGLALPTPLPILGRAFLTRIGCAASAGGR